MFVCEYACVCVFVCVVQGNLNAIVGPNTYQHLAGTVGRFGMGETTEDGDS